MHKVLRKNIVNDLVMEEMVFSFKKLENKRIIFAMSNLPKSYFIKEVKNTKVLY